jgi:hypothetical protein
MQGDSQDRLSDPDHHSNARLADIRKTKYSYALSAMGDLVRSLLRGTAPRFDERHEDARTKRYRIVGILVACVRELQTTNRPQT